MKPKSVWRNISERKVVHLDLSVISRCDEKCRNGETDEHGRGDQLSLMEES